MHKRTVLPILFVTLCCASTVLGQGQNIISTVAGNGQSGFSGDGGPATAAAVSPGAVAVDANGNLFLTDNGRVRRVDAATGIISTVAGVGGCAFGGDGGPATAASFCDPSGVA